jgi:integrase/recombinase XerD
MKTIVLKRFYHREGWRIGLFFSYDENFSIVIKSITGIRYSGTNKCWYTDDNEDSLKEIFQAFSGKADIDMSAISATKSLENTSPPVEKTKDNDPKGKVEQITPYSENEDRESDLIPEYRTIEKVIETSRYGPVEFRIDETDGRLAIRFSGYFDKSWIDEITSFGKYYYDKAHEEYLLPWSAVTVDSLSDYFSSKGVEVRIIKPTVSDSLKTARKELGDEIRSRELGKRALEGLELMQKYLDEVRYSRRTSESYIPLLELFFKYYYEKDPDKITNKEVTSFVNDFIINNGYSSSYQNQMISAIKTFYRISVKRKIDWRMFERPRRSRALPKVFSKDEVRRILSATKNDKHKLLLWMIYSCGLRRSEITNILITDLDRERSILHIRQGKGRVDRIVPVSQKVWEKVDQYISGFTPGKYLFEGQTGERYSSESVYRVFKQAMVNAGIKKDVGVHSLRHSYATHLHESGLDIKYIQELLGHKSTRTTEIYTHVSRRNLAGLRSPIEDLDVR